MIDLKRYYVWGWYNDGKYHANKLLDEKPAKAVIFGPEEFELFHGWHEGVIPKDMDLTVVLGSSDKEYYLTDYRNQSVPTYCNIVLWNTYWFSLTYHSIYDMLEFPLTDIDKLYISFNFKPHKHRCMLMDELCHANLLEHGHNTWHDTDPDSIARLSNRYEWKYWTPEPLLLDTDFYRDSQIHPYSLPPEYGSTLINVITETTTRTIFITEKTCMAILLNKPFIVLGSKGFHAELVKLGFELYDELFDYSFDEHEDEADRLAGIVDNLKSLVGQDYNKLREQTLAKAHRNRQRAIEIATSRKYFPEFMLKYIEFLKENPKQLIGRDPNYLQLEQLLLD